MRNQVSYRKMLEVLEDWGGLPVPELDDVEWAMIRERAVFQREDRDR